METRKRKHSLVPGVNKWESLFVPSSLRPLSLPLPRPALTQYHKGKRAHKQEDILLSGWLTKESTSTGTLARVSTGSRKKRYFVLTANSLEFYRSVELQQKMGAIALNSLCSVTLPDEKVFKEEGG